MQRRGQRKSGEGDVYVVIDELADLMTTCRKTVQPMIQRLCQIGRAAAVHVIACTQCPIAAVIPTPIKVNFDSRFALRTRSAQDSRNILGVKGCEGLPRYGQAYYLTPEGLRLYQIPMISDEEIEERVRYWHRQASPPQIRHACPACEPVFSPHSLPPEAAQCPPPSPHCPQAPL